MKITAWALFAIGVILTGFVIVSYLFTMGANDAGPTNPAAGMGETVSHTYLWAAIPAVISVLIGLYLLLSHGKGYKVTYDTTEQQVSE